MKRKVLTWLYKMFRFKPAEPFTPELVANQMKQPVDQVKAAIEELRDAGALKPASSLKRNTFRLTVMGFMIAAKIAQNH